MKSVALHNRLNRVFLKSFTFLFLFFISFSVLSQDDAVDEARQKDGRKLFKSLCSSCHKLDKDFIGPLLGGVEERRENDWLKKWIKNNAELRASGDRDAIAIYEKWNKSNMTAFPQLTDVQIDNILYYTTVGDPKPKVDPTLATTSTQAPTEVPRWIWFILAAI